MKAVSIGNGQLHSMGMAELANPLDCMHDAQAILIRERERESCDCMDNHAEGGDAMTSVVRRLTPLE